MVRTTGVIILDFIVTRSFPTSFSKEEEEEGIISHILCHSYWASLIF